MIVIRRCLSTSSSSGQSIVRQQRKVPKPVPFKPDVSAESTRRSVGSIESRTVRLSPRSKPVNKDVVTADKSNSRNLNIGVSAERGEQRGTALRSARRTKRSDSRDSAVTINAIGGRINRKAIDGESEKSIGGSIAVTLSATAKHRKEKQSSRETLTHADGNVVNPSTLSIPIAPSQIVMEKTLPPRSESISQLNPTEKELITNSNGSKSMYVVPLIAALGATGYFLIQKEEITPEKGKASPKISTN